ncbi:MAG TPA: MYXO-CTERM sorting domain-containing protein [Polyangia bacterium]|nr:MYXO-CTERM sorting domain-containing protein [Polyangia bacterium]
MRAAPWLAAIAAALAPFGAARADEVVQMPLLDVLDGRPVSTLTNGAEVRWTTGIDASDGFVTSALASHLGQSGPALPDDGVFPASADRPEIVLHFSNAAAATAPQAHLLAGEGQYSFAVPAATYSKVHLLFTSSRGDSTITLTFLYADGPSSIFTVTVPDWGTGNPLPTNPPIFFALVGGLHKWNAQDLSVDTPTHGITGVTLTPAADRVLRQIQVSKTGAMPYLTLWGVTGVATSAVGDAQPSPDGGPPADGSSDGAAPSGAGDAGGASGVDAATAPDTGTTDSRPGTPGADSGAPFDAGAAADTATGTRTDEAGCRCAVDRAGAPSLPLLLLGAGLLARRRRR